MLKTLSRFTSSFTSLFAETAAAPLTEVDADGRIEDIRTAMLYQLAMMDGATDCSYVWSCVVRAYDIHALWYLRSDLVSALSTSLGEPAAREKVKPITAMFQGVVPRHYFQAGGAGPRSRAL